MKSIIYYSKPQKVNQLNVPNISRRGFSKLPLVFGKTSMEVKIHWMHRTTFARIKVSDMSLHLASWSTMWSHTEIHTQVCPRAPAVRSEGCEGGEKGQSRLWHFPFCNRGMRVTLEHCRVIKLHVPWSLAEAWDGHKWWGRWSHRRALSIKIPKTLKEGRKEQATVSHCSHIVSGWNCG